MIRLDEEEQKTHDPNFWDDPKQAEQQLRKVTSIKKWTEAYAAVEKASEDLQVLADFYKEGEATMDDVEKQYNETLQLLENLEYKNMLRIKNVEVYLMHLDDIDAISDKIQDSGYRLAPLFDEE